MSAEQCYMGRILTLHAREVAKIRCLVQLLRHLIPSLISHGVQGSSSPSKKQKPPTSIVTVALALLLQQEDRSLLLSQNKDVRKRLVFPDAKKREIS